MAPTAAPRSAWRWTSPVWCLIGIATIYLVVQCFTEDQKQSGSYGCEMSYMWPTYRVVDWPDSPSNKYALYLYREQGWDRNDQPTGHPVIFIPGNAGSYKQVRSIASSAARQYYTEQGSVASGMEDTTSLDFFAVDYNEEFSAFHAPTLWDQASYLAHSVRHVLEQYKHLPEPSRPRQVTLLGHSMGGIVARLAMADLPGLVDVIITMSTPHALPPVTLSRDMDDVYNSLDQQVHNRTSHLLFSICGGTADTQIASDACVIPPKSISPDNGFTIFTTGMPGAWTGVEHQTMVWCHQIRSKVARTLLDMTASSHRQDKLAVARDWLLGEKSVVEPGHSNPIRVPVTATQMSLRISDSSYDTGSPIRWCREVSECQLVDAETAILPAPKNREAPFPLPGEGIRPEEKLIVLDFKLPESSGFIEVYTSQDHVQSGSYGRAIAQDNTWRTSQEYRDHSHLVLHFPKASRLSLIVHRLRIDTPHCEGRSPTIRYRVNAADAGNTVHESRFFPNAEGDIYLHAHSASAPYISSAPQGIDIDIYQDPACAIVSASLSTAHGASLAKMVTRYRMAALAWIIGWAAWIMRRWMVMTAESNGSIPSIGVVLNEEGLSGFVYGLFLIGSGCMAAPLIPVENLFLDLSVSMRNVWALGILSFAVVNIVWTLIALSQRVVGLVIKPKRQNNTTVSTGLFSWSPVIIGVLTLLAVHFVVPHQMAFVILFLALLAALIQEEPHTSRYNLMSAVVLLLVLLLPFNAPVLAVWGRSVWADFRNTSPGDYGALRIAPLLILVLSCLSGRPLKLDNKVALMILLQWTLAILSIAAFAFGGRRTWIIPYTVDVVYVELAGLFL